MGSPSEVQWETDGESDIAFLFGSDFHPDLEKNKTV